jgi:hypothetical protein
MRWISTNLFLICANLFVSPVFASGLTKILNDYAEQAAANRVAEMRNLIGPNYEAAPETTLSPSSREAQANIKPDSLRHTSYNGTFAEVIGTDRDPNTPQEAAVGSVAWATFNYFVRPSARLESAIEYKVNSREHYSAPAGSRLTLTADGICTAEKLAFVDNKPKRRICFSDPYGDGQIDSVSGIAKAQPNNQLPSSARYRIFANAMVASKYRRELVYLGRMQDTLRFAYREYQTSLIRPAFTTEMTYTVEKTGPTIVRFQNTVLEISAISNEGIRYTK